MTRRLIVIYWVTRQRRCHVCNVSLAELQDDGNVNRRSLPTGMGVVRGCSRNFWLFDSRSLAPRLVKNAGPVVSRGVEVCRYNIATKWGCRRLVGLKGSGGKRFKERAFQKETAMGNFPCFQKPSFLLFVSQRCVAASYARLYCHSAENCVKA